MQACTAGYVLTSVTTPKSSQLLDYTQPKLALLIRPLHGPNREHRLQQFLYFCVCICCGDQVICLPWKRVDRATVQQRTSLVLQFWLRADMSQYYT
jgi:hypothetical protein